MKGIGILSRRGMALLIALFLLLLPLAGLAAALPPQDLTITVQWEGWQGTQISDPAVAIPYDGFANRYWLTLPPDAPLEGLTLQIQDMTGNYAFFEPGSDTALQFVKDAGDNLFFIEPIQIMAFNANGDMTGLYFLYISFQELPADPYAPTPTEEPLPTEIPAQPATVTIHYVDENWTPIAEDTYQTVNPGYNTVYPDAPINSGDYTLFGATSAEVYVDANGANPAEVTFTYMRVARPATVTVHYVNEYYQPIAPDTYQTLNPGYNTVYPDVTFSPEEYEMTGAASYDVYVDANGANPAEITFTYRHPVMPATVVIHYVDDLGTAIAEDTVQTVNPGNNTVYPAVYINPDDYQLTGSGSYDVYVDANGANPAEVTFTYQRAARPATVTVHYVDDNYAPIAADTYQTVNPGENTVYPDAAVNGEDWELISDSAVNVTVDANGANPPEITFIY
ncbi:MAG: MucBP domain-containing protein, partial [Clostridia bacterium]|nr:MucBP domain-containing protein [Clostridia bacterium]